MQVLHRSTDVRTTSSIHHPRGDIRHIDFDNPLELRGHTGHNDTLYISCVVLILLEGSEFGRTSISIRGLGRIRFEDVEFPLIVKNDSEVHLPVKKVGPG
ncbi:unnamed protein product [Cuscuta campestris]|uniref:Uncharacterized protein n=1 Tax=Cuscuta campestris TaxID=132261 RepID=A0A484L004_9ASTE|nr:unnamed protein product [Cuscuta campestris]